MKVRIYTSAAADKSTPGPAGWSFLVSNDINLTGDATIQYSGCTKATLHVAQAMVILQALYWLREHKTTIKEYTIFCDDITAIHCKVAGLDKRIADLHLGNITVLDAQDDLSELNESLATKAWYKVMHDSNATFEGIEVGDKLVKKAPLFSENYLVMAKFGSNAVSLKNLSTASKRIIPFSKTEFDGGSFIKM